jgi:tripartite-type tricarboxylate transporter receptor subunit TctC
MTFMTTIVARSVMAGALGLGLAAAHAEDPSAYPTKPIRLVLPFPPGGGTDSLARIMAPKMGELLGRAVVVDNRAGAAGNIATDLVTKADPDGYTVLMGFSTALTMNPSLYEHLPFDVQRDLKPVTLLASAQYVLVVNPSVPVKSVKELIAYAKAKPGQLNYSSSGSGSPLHLAGELFKYQTGTQITHVPYKGGGPAVMGLLGGQVQLAFGSVAAVMPQVRDGRLRALAVTSLKPSPVAPELPTLDKSGLPGFDVTTWYGFLVPKGTPDPIVAKLQAAAQKVVQLPEVQKAMADQGLEMEVEAPAQFAERIKSESQAWSKLIKEMHITAND